MAKKAVDYAMNDELKNKTAQVKAATTTSLNGRGKRL